jgi:hypothetical protein
VRADSSALTLDRISEETSILVAYSGLLKKVLSFEKNIFVLKGILNPLKPSDYYIYHPL